LLRVIGSDAEVFRDIVSVKKCGTYIEKDTQSLIWCHDRKTISKEHRNFTVTKVS